MENSIQLMAVHVPFAVLVVTGRATVMTPPPVMKGEVNCVL